MLSITIFIGKQDQQWGLDYFESINNCIKSNRLLPTSNYCLGKGRNTGQMSWTNVFREEVEIIKMKGNYMYVNLTSL